MGSRLITLAVAALFLYSPFAVHAEGTSTAENRPGLVTVADADKIKGELDQIDPQIETHKLAIDSCKQSVSSTDSACSASQNPNAQQAQSGMNNYQSQAQTQTASSPEAGGGQSAGCMDFSKMLSPAGDNAQQYSQACDSSRGQCKSACQEKAQASEKACASVQGTTPEDTQKKKMACQKNAAKVKKYSEAGSKTCEAGYKPNSDMAKALMAAIGGLLSAMQNCQEDLAVTPTPTPTPDNQQCTVNMDPKDCNRMMGTGVNELAKKMMADTTSSSPDAISQDSVDGSPTRKGGKGGGNSPPFAPGGVGGSGGRAGDAKSDPAAAKAAANTNIYAGDQGGGGGRNVAGGGYPDAPDGAGLKAALANADARKNGIGNQFTGSMGRSNWQKVNDQYKGQSPSLGASRAQ